MLLLLKRKIITGYQEASAFDLFKMYSFSHIMRNILSLLLVIPKTIFRTKKMTKKWPFDDYHLI